MSAGGERDAVVGGDEGEEGAVGWACGVVLVEPGGVEEGLGPGGYGAEVTAAVGGAVVGFQAGVARVDVDAAYQGELL